MYVDGDNLFTAGLILAIMILPYITAISYDICQAVPRPQREGSLALGATRWQTTWNVVLPYARPGIVSGCFLALGRALGETMAVIMVIGNANQISFAPYAPGATIPSKIALGLNELGDIGRSALVELGAILLLVTIFVNALARLIIWRFGKQVKASPRAERTAGIVWGRIFPAAGLLCLAFVAVRIAVSASGAEVNDFGVLVLTLVVALSLAVRPLACAPSSCTANRPLCGSIAS